MSVKPDDIPQNIWDKAYHTVEECTFEMHPADFLEMVRHVSRSIMAAVEEEREACAKLIETFPRTIPNPDHIVERYGMFVRQTGRDDLSEAIRNRQSKDG